MRTKYTQHTQYGWYTNTCKEGYISTYKGNVTHNTQQADKAKANKCNQGTN